MHYGKMVDSHENASRMDRMYAAITTSGQHEMLEPEDNGIALIEQVHDHGYIEFLRTTWERWSAMGKTDPLIPATWATGSFGGEHAGGQSNSIPALIGRYSFAADAPLTAGTWQAAYTGAQSAITAQRLVSAGDRAAFALTRPPGHHAHKDLSGGYCFLNNAAIAAQGFRAGGKKVAIIDIDFHHGNGTQDIFYDSSDVLTQSLHGDPDTCFPFYLGFERETGTGEGQGFNQHFAMPLGTGYSDWVVSLNKACERATAFGAEALVIPLGVDAHENDPISGFKLTTEDFGSAATVLASLNLPTIITMEGGYDMESLGKNVATFINSFS